MALNPSSRLGPYEVIALLGAGGQGEVYRARDIRLERDVAIKVLPERLSSDPSLKQRLEREAKAISRLSHHSHLRPVRHTPVWSPDRKQILFSSNRSLIFRAYLKNADGSGSEEEIASAGDAQFRALDWSHDGKYVLLQRNEVLFYLRWPERELQPLLETNGVVRGAQFSPDGRWVAYVSNESGSLEVYVSPFPSMTSKWQVSSRGGEEPRWRQDGGELFYLSADGGMMAAKGTPASSFEASSPVALFQVHRRQPVASYDVFSYAVSGDGNRFLIATKLDDARAAPLSVFLNWTSEMEE